MVPESPRYLITHNRSDEAKKIFKRIAKSNKRKFVDNDQPATINGEISSKGNEVSVKPLTETKEVRIHFSRAFFIV